MGILSADVISRSAIVRGARDRVNTRALSAIWPVSLILAMQVILSYVEVRNTAFQDEGLYLYAGRQIVTQWMGGPPPLENYANYFSGYPYLYPPIGGLLDKLGGLELARAFSLICMLAVTVIVYLISRRFFEAMAAYFATALFACSAPVLWVSRLATYDALCLLLIATATYVALRVSAGNVRWALAIPSVLLVVAFMAKYLAVLYIGPVLALLAIGLYMSHGWRMTLRRIGIPIAALLLTALLTYLLMDKYALHAINGSTLNRGTEFVAQRTQLILRVLQLGGVVYAVALVGVILVVLRLPRLRLLAAALFVTSLLMPLGHIYKQEFVSLDKHVAYGLFFAAPLAGYALAALAEGADALASTATTQRWLAGLFVVLIVFVTTLSLAQPTWANTTELSHVMHTQMRDGAGRYLMEDLEVARYDAADVAEPWQWNAVNVFDYIDYVNASHQRYAGAAALRKTVDDRYYALIELSFVAHPNEAYLIAGQMVATRNYDLIAKIPYSDSYGTGYFFIFRSAQTAGQGNFTSLLQLGAFA